MEPLHPLWHSASVHPLPPHLSNPLWAPWSLDAHCWLQVTPSSIALDSTGSWCMDGLVGEETHECQQTEWSITRLFWQGDPTKCKPIGSLSFSAHSPTPQSLSCSPMHLYINPSMLLFLFHASHLMNPLEFLNLLELKNIGKVDHHCLIPSASAYTYHKQKSPWNVPAEHFHSYVPNTTLIGFYTYTHSSPCLYSVINLITLLHLIFFPIISSQFGVYLNFVFPFQKFTFWTQHPSFPSPALEEEWDWPRHISDVLLYTARELPIPTCSPPHERRWASSQGWQHHPAGHHPTVSKQGKQSRAGDGNGFAIKQKQSDKSGPESSQSPS